MNSIPSQKVNPLELEFAIQAGGRVVNVPVSLSDRAQPASEDRISHVPAGQTCKGCLNCKSRGK